MGNWCLDNKNFRKGVLILVDSCTTTHGVSNHVFSFAKVAPSMQPVAGTTAVEKNQYQ
jgi:hypothetical protein